MYQGIKTIERNRTFLRYTSIKQNVLISIIKRNLSYKGLTVMLLTDLYYNFALKIKQEPLWQLPNNSSKASPLQK